MASPYIYFDLIALQLFHFHDIIIYLFLAKIEITFVFSVFSFKTANGLEVADSTMAVWTCPIVYLVNDITVVPCEREFEFEFEYVIFPSLLLRLSSKLWS